MDIYLPCGCQVEVNYNWMDGTLEYEIIHDCTEDSEEETLDN